MSVEEKTEKLYEIFKDEMKKKGYTFEQVDTESEHYQEGLRLKYVIPTDIALQPHQLPTQQMDQSMPITMVAKGAPKKFFKHMTEFYAEAHSIIKKLGKKPNMPEPMFSRDGRQVIYVGFKQEDPFEIFKDEMKRNKYQLQETNPESNTYKKGARFAYRVPEQLWMDLRQTQTSQTQVFSKITPELKQHITEFYSKAREAAKKTGKELSYTAPDNPTSTDMFIYVGLK